MISELSVGIAEQPANSLDVQKIVVEKHKEIYDAETRLKLKARMFFLPTDSQRLFDFLKKTNENKVNPKQMTTK